MAKNILNHSNHLTMQPLFYLLHPLHVNSDLIELFFMTAPLTFLKEVRDELKKVVWPTQNEVIRLTLVVILTSLLVGLFIGALDFVFTKTMGIVIK